MQGRILLPLWLLTAIPWGSSPAMAADAGMGWYGGANVGQSRMKVDTTGIDTAVMATGLVATSATTASENDVGFKLFGGYRFHPNFAVEAGYFNLGKVGFTTITTGPAATIGGEAKNENGFNIDLVGIAPLSDVFSLFARVGVQTSKTSITAAGIGPGGTSAVSSSETSASYKAGVGAQYEFTKNIGGRLEWERYHVPGGAAGIDKFDVDSFSLGMVVRF